VILFPSQLKKKDTDPVTSDVLILVAFQIWTKLLKKPPIDIEESEIFISRHLFQGSRQYVLFLSHSYSTKQCTKQRSSEEKLIIWGSKIRLMNGLVQQCLFDGVRARSDELSV
jgi:hypothetical protein